MADNSTKHDVVEVPLRLSDRIKNELREWGATLSVFIPVFLIFSGLFFELRVIPSESMVPNLQVGDRVAVNKFAYGYSKNSLPFSFGRYLPLPQGRIFASQPKRGDIAVFEHPHTPRVMIKRIIGLPGDEIQLRNGHIILNGSPIQRDFIGRVRYIENGRNVRVLAREYRERIGDVAWLSHTWENVSSLDNTPTFIVPDGHYFFMGDNRDNSLDGRAVSGHCPEARAGVILGAGCAPRNGISDKRASIGFVPFSNLIGRADTVLFSTYSCRRAGAEPCMKSRVWRGL